MRSLIDLFGGHFLSPIADPYEVYARLRRESPVLAVEVPMGVTHFVSTYDDVATVLRDNRTYSSKANARGAGVIMGRTILEMDGKEHQRHRGVIAHAFVPKLVERDLPPVLEAIAHELVDAFAADGSADLVKTLSERYPVRVLAHVIGIPVEDYEQFHSWAVAISEFPADPPAGMKAAEELVAYLAPIVEERRREPRDDLMSRIIHADFEGERLSDEEVYGFLRLLIPAGAETTYRLIGSTLLGLLENPSWLDRVRADFAHLDRVVEETLRWESPVCFASRETTEAVTLGGVDIPEGADVLVAISSANRDETRFDAPNRFDPNRPEDEHFAFGGGRHFCIGAHLARLEAKTVVRVLLERLPEIRLDAGAEPPHVVGLAFRSPDRLSVRF